MPNTPLPDDVRRWIDQQDEAERGALARTWDLAGLAAAPDAASDTDAAWARLDALLDDGEPSGLQAWQDRERPGLAPPADLAPPWRRAPQTAAWVGLLAAAAVALFVWVRPTTVAASDAVLALTLPDGSAVTLAPGSEIAYRRGLGGDARRVTLEGQAFFDVTSDGRPFVVETFNAEVEVLGTQFDVLAWPDAAAAETAVALVEGSVRLRSQGAFVVLEPGQTSRAAGGAPTPPTAVDAEAVAAWRDGGFSVVDAPLGLVTAALAARFGRPVGLGPGVDASRRLTLYLPSADSADVVLRDVAAYLDLRLEIGPARYDLVSR